MSKHPHNAIAFSQGTRDNEVRNFLSRRQLRKLNTWKDSRVLKTDTRYEVVLHAHDS